MDVNWYTESNYEVRNRQFLRLYRKHTHANVKLDNCHNPLATSIIGGTCVAATMAIGDRIFQLNLSPWAIATGFFAGEYISLLPLAEKFQKIYGTEKKMMDIIEKNGSTMIDKADYYVLVDNVYYLDEQAYFDAYYNMIKPENDGYAKQIKRTKK